MLREMNGAGVSELANQLNLPKSTVHDHLQTLENLGFLRNDNDVYQVTLKFLDYGGSVRRKTDIYPAGWPEVQNLALETGEHANLMIEEHGKGRYIYIAEGEDSAKLDTYTGMEVYLHASAMGKAMLAHFPQEKLDRIIETQGLPELTENTITSRDPLAEDLGEIQSCGVATDIEERTIGVRCIAAPIKGVNGEIYASVGVSGPTRRFEGERFYQEFPDMVQRAANLIELNIQNS